MLFIKLEPFEQGGQSFVLLDCVDGFVDQRLSSGYEGNFSRTLDQVIVLAISRIRIFTVPLSMTVQLLTVVAEDIVELAYG